MNLICLPDPSLQRPRNLHLPPSFAWFCTFLEEVKASCFPLQHIQTTGCMDVGSGRPHSLDPHIPWTSLEIFQSYHVNNTFVFCHCQLWNSTLHESPSHILQKRIRNFEKVMKFYCCKRGPRKERECWCHFLGWVSKRFFPTFFKKWKYICSLEPVDHKTSNHAFLIPESGKRRLLRCFKILTALLNNICCKNLISKWIQILYFSLLSKTCKEIAFCEFLFHMVLLTLDFESLLPFCAMTYRTPWTLESCCFLLISRGEQILYFMGPKTVHIFQ